MPQQMAHFFWAFYELIKMKYYEQQFSKEHELLCHNKGTLFVGFL